MLSGLKVLDLSGVLAGPLCAMILGDLGADLLKVERPGSGDDTRGWGPPFDDAGESAYFLSVNRNKLGITADLAASADMGFVKQLAAAADVIVVLDRYASGRRALGLATISSCRRSRAGCRSPARRMGNR